MSNISHSAPHASEGPAGASFEEKSVWITLVSLLVAFSLYFYSAGHMLLAGVNEVPPYLFVLGVFVTLQVGVLVVAHIAVAVASRPEGRDERDRVIQWRAENNSGWLLGVAVLAAVFCMATSIPPAWIANGLLAALFLSEVLSCVLRLLYYRRGM